MAQIVRQKLKRRGSYPWDEWTNGRTWRIQQGVDFFCDMASMRSLLYSKAKRMKKTVTTSGTDGDDVIVFEFGD